jgi:hypothetical protein
MQIQDFVNVYRAKTDDQLLQLVAVPEQLTSEARLALQGELSRRQIHVAEDSGAFHDNGNGHSAVAVISSARLQEAERQGLGEFIADVLRTYHSRFWLFFRITAPAVIVGTIAIITSRNEIREILRHLPHGVELLNHRTEILEIGLCNLSAYLISWLASLISFGVTCIVVEEAAAGFSPAALHSFLNLRERLGPFLRLSFLLFGLALLAEGASILAMGGMYRVLWHWQLRPRPFVMLVASYLTVSLALLAFSRLALAVPAVILDDYGVWRAILRSDELTEGKWLPLAALLVKSLVGGYAAGLLPFWLASFIRVDAPLPSWFPWVLTVGSIIGVTVVEPTMFVGFAVLYLKTSATSPLPRKMLSDQPA